MKALRIFLLVLIIIGLGLIATEHFWVPTVVDQIMGSDVQMATSTPPTPAKQAVNNSLQTYTSNQYGFSFNYPKNVSINPNPPGENTMPENYDVMVGTIKGNIVSGRLSINFGPGVTSCTNLSFVTDLATASEYNDYTYSSGATTTINGVPFFSFSDNYSGGKNFFQYDYVYSVIRSTKNGDRCYSIDITIRPNTPDATIDPSKVGAALVEKDTILAKLMPIVQSFTFSN